MSLTVSQLFTAPTAEEIRAAMVADLVSVGIPADKWRSGGVVSTMLTVASMSIALLAALVALIIQGFFLPTSTGNSLKLLAIYMFGVEIPEASFATGNVTLTNTGGASYSLGVGEYTALNPTTKVNYTNSAAFVLGPLGTASVPMVAATIGGAGNAAPGTITTNVTVLLGVTVTNPTALVGVDAPSDEDIRTLCLNSLGARSVRGVRTAYAYAVQTAENSVTNAPVNINRYVVSSASHTGDVTVYVASPAGAPDANDVSGVATNVEAIARPEAVTAVVTGATAVAYTHALTIWASVPAGVSAADVKTAADAAVLAFLETYPIGGVTANDDANPSVPFTGLFAAGIYGVLAEAVTELGGKMLSAQGAVDLALTAAQVATDGITLTVRLISPTSGTTVS